MGQGGEGAAGSRFTVDWLDAGKEPQNPPNPAFPNGITVNVAGSATHSCTVELPYPAKRIGAYRVTCQLCGSKVGCTTAGRPDDPHTLIMPCRLAGGMRPQ